MKTKKSSKQILLERKTALEKRIIELEAEYDSRVKRWKKIKYVKDFPMLGKEEWISLNVEEWKSRQLMTITGKYQDKKKIVSTYQQKFVEFIRQLCPDIIEELKAFTSLFDKLFKANKDKYINLFDQRRIVLSNFNDLQNTCINSLIPYYPLLQFRPYRSRNFRSEYRWGENRVLLYFL